MSRFRVTLGFQEEGNANVEHAPARSKRAKDAAGEVRAIQPHSTPVLGENLRSIVTFLIMVAIESVNCVAVAEGAVDDNLADRVEAQKAHGLALIAATSARR